MPFSVASFAIAEVHPISGADLSVGADRTSCLAAAPYFALTHVNAVKRHCLLSEGNEAATKARKRQRSNN